MEIKFPLPTHPWEIKAAKDYNGQGILEQLSTVQMKKWEGFDEDSVDNWLTLATGNYIMDQLRNLVFVSIISADNNEFGLTEDQKQEIIQRRKLNMDWDYVFEPIADEKKRRMLVELFNESDID